MRNFTINKEKREELPEPMLQNYSDNNDFLAERYEQMLKSGESIFFDADEFERIIEHFLENYDYAKALGAAEQACEIYPFSNDLKLLLAESCLFNDKKAEAWEIISFLDAALPKNPELYILKGIFSSFEDRHTQAIEYFLKAYRECEDRVRINTLLAVEYASISNFRMAQRHMENVVSLEPDEPAHMETLANCYEQSGSVGQAITFFEKMVDDYPYNSRAWHKLGTFYTYKESNEKALKAFEYAYLIDPSFIGAYYDMADQYIRMERFKDAIDSLKEAIGVATQEDSYPFMKIGECYQMLDDFELAAEYYLKAAHLDPQMGKAWYNLAAIHLDNNFKEQALQYIKQAIHVEDDDIENWRLYAEIEQNLNHTADALFCFHKIISMEENISEDWLDLAWLLHQNGMDSEAITILRDAKVIFPDDHEIDYHIGALQVFGGDAAGGVKCIRQAMKKAPEFTNIIEENYSELLVYPEILKMVKKIS